MEKDRNNYRADNHGQMFRQARRGPTNAYPETTGLREENRHRPSLPNNRVCLPPAMSSNPAEEETIVAEDRNNRRADSHGQMFRQARRGQTNVYLKTTGLLEENRPRPSLPNSPAPDSIEVKNKALR